MKFLKNIISTISLKNVVQQVTQQLHGKLSFFSISALLVGWVYFLHDYSKIGMPWLSPIIMIASAVTIYKQWWNALPLLTVLVIFGNYYGYEHKIDHYILFDILPLMMWTIIKFKDVWYLYFLTSFYFSTSGFAKLYHGWLNWETQRVENIIIYFHKALNIETIGGMKILNLNLPTFIWEITDYVTVLFELAWLLIMLFPNLIKVLIPCAIIFHIVNWYLLDINYWPMLVVYTLFLLIEKQNRN